MGFPLSTDIFGQLAWLVNQVKLLIFRVTRIEQNGTSGVQNINQVLNVGSTATNKTQTFVVPTGIIGIGKDAVTGLYPTDGIEFQSNVNNTKTSLFELLTVKNVDVFNNIFYGSYGHSEIGFYDSRLGGYFPITIGRFSGYAGGIGFTITNNTGDTISSDPTQYVIESSTVINNITANGILMTKKGFPNINCGLVADFTSDPVLKTTLNGNDAGFYFQNNKTFTIGKENAGSYFGIKTDESILYAGGIRQTSVDYNTPSGFIPIRIDGNDYYIELWTT